MNCQKNIVDTGLITSTGITGGVSIATFVSAAGLPVGIALSETSNSYYTKISKNLYRKARKIRCH